MAAPSKSRRNPGSRSSIASYFTQRDKRCRAVPIVKCPWYLKQILLVWSGSSEDFHSYGWKSGRVWRPVVSTSKRMANRHVWDVATGGQRIFHLLDWVLTLGRLSDWKIQFRGAVQSMMQHIQLAVRVLGRDHRGGANGPAFRLWAAESCRASPWV